MLCGNVDIGCLQAISEGADAVIAVGGDGTLHEVKLVSIREETHLF